MNYHHAFRWNAPGEWRRYIDLDEDPCCTDKTCTRDHFIVIPSSLWNDSQFLLDRLGVLSAREFAKRKEQQLLDGMRSPE